MLFSCPWNGYFVVQIIAVRKWHCRYGPHTRHVKLRVVQAPGMPGTLSLSLTSKETTSYRPWYASPHMRRARALMHVGIANPRWRGKRSRYSQCMRNPQFYAFGKRPMGWLSGNTNCHGCWDNLNTCNTFLIYMNHKYFFKKYWLLWKILQL